MSDLSNTVKNIFLGGVGAIALTAEKSKELVDQLVEKGEITVEQGKVLNEELKRDLKEKVSDATSAIKTRESVEKIADRLDQMKPEEIQLLKDKLDALSSQKTEQTADADVDVKTDTENKR
ncbi:MAG: hypothetical protein WBI07_10420 [Mobilitalea sp.]